MAQWKVSDRALLAAGIHEPGVCKCKREILSYVVTMPAEIVRAPVLRVGVLRLLAGQLLPTILPPIPEPREVRRKEYRHKVFKTKCKWCKYLAAMGVTHVHIDYEPRTLVYTIIRED